jgi:hypothetical protein
MECDSLEKLKSKLDAKLTLQILKARKDPAYFTEFCFLNEKNGKRIVNEEFHQTWHQFLSDNRWGVLISPIGHGKTVQVGVSRTLWEIGKNPNIRILLIGESERAAKKILRNIQGHIERNSKLSLVFPHLKRSTNQEDPWNSTDIVIDRPIPSRDPTVQARGIGSKNILGSRLDLIILDDVLNLENTSSQMQREKYEDWFFTTCFTRVQDDYDAKGDLISGGKVYCIGTPWNTDDLLHRLSARKKWASLRFSAVKNYRDHESLWKPLWPRVWPLKRILDRRDGSTETSFARTMLCVVMTDEQRRFKEEWLVRMLHMGRNRYMLDKAPYFNGNIMRCITGVDIGIGKQAKDAKTVLFTIAIDPRNKKRIIIDIESGKWDGPMIVSKIEEKNYRYNAIVNVESNQAQKFIAQFAHERGVPVHAAFTTKQNKYNEEFGVESLATELRAGLWVAPSGKDGKEIDREIKDWLNDMREYDPELHTGDHLMASWIAREGARKYSKEMFRKSNHNMR